MTFVRNAVSEHVVSSSSGSGQSHTKYISKLHFGSQILTALCSSRYDTIYLRALKSWQTKKL